MVDRALVSKWLKKTNGIMTTQSTFVFRESYFGRSIIAPNSSKNDADHRGFVPVERWIMSMVENANPKKLQNEGLTKINIFEEEVFLRQLRDVAGELIFGSFATDWPLAKIIDIGGKEVQTTFGTREVMPIPAHVHGGVIEQGIAIKPGKTEAYFFPPIDLPPYNAHFSVHTRIGLKPSTTKEEFKSRLAQYGLNDSMYELLNAYPIRPMTGWFVPDGVVHAPGPYVTFEIQRPQDDCNFAAWRLGEQLTDDERHGWYQKKVMKGLPDEKTYIDELLDWNNSTRPDIESAYFHEAKVIENGSWGSRLQIFFDLFYGEWIIIHPHHSLKLSQRELPHAGIVWSGMGEINGNHINQTEASEFFIVPHTEVTITNSASTDMHLGIFGPMRK